MSYLLHLDSQRWEMHMCVMDAGSGHIGMCVWVVSVRLPWSYASAPGPLPFRSPPFLCLLSCPVASLDIRVNHILLEAGQPIAIQHYQAIN